MTNNQTSLGKTLNRVLNNMHQRQAYDLEKALRAMMAAYERRVRSDCKTPEDLAKQPWRCSEYVAAEDLLDMLDTDPQAGATHD